MNTIESCHTALHSLLPWYVNGTLDEAEREALEAHLAVCDHCAKAYQQERMLAKAVNTTPDNIPDAGNALADLEAGQDFERPRRRSARQRKGVIHSSWLPGIAIAQAAVIAALAVALLLVINPNSVPASYHTVSDVPVNTLATFDVVFAPETQQATITALLESNNVQIIAGPNAAGAYTLATTEEANAARARFQASPTVEFVGALTPARE